MRIVLPIATLFSFAVTSSMSLRAQAVITPGGSDSSDNHALNETAAVRPAPGSGVRIVRLSQVKGAVQLDRNTGAGLEIAFANLPVTEGQKLETGEGVAEVEFEDNSTLRLTPESFVEFLRLKRAANGDTSSQVLVRSGTVYVSTAKAKTEDFKLSVGKRTILLPPASHIRLDVKDGTSKLTVFSGEVRLENATADIVVGKKKSVTFDTSTPGAALLAGNTEDEPFDAWDKQSADYHNLRSVPVSSFGSSYAYGANDLSYYGSFVNAASCGGAMWRPYLTSAAWSPYANGVWAWYPDAGYSWVSPYPWGWTPFHSGSWAFCGGAGGWGWRPGGSWYGLENSPVNLLANHGPTRLPGNAPGAQPVVPRPPAPPSSGRPTLSVVNTQPPSISRMVAGDKLEFRNDSAGLGVPRGVVGRLNNISREAAQHGLVSKTVQTTALTSPAAGRNATYTNAGAMRQNGPDASRVNAASSHNERSAGAGSAASHMPSSPAPSPGGGGGSFGGAGHSGGSGSAPAGGAGHR